MTHTDHIAEEAPTTPFLACPVCKSKDPRRREVKDLAQFTQRSRAEATRAATWGLWKPASVLSSLLGSLFKQTPQPESLSDPKGTQQPAGTR